MSNGRTGVHFKEFTRAEIECAFGPRRKSSKIADKTACRVCMKEPIKTSGMCYDCSIKAALVYMREEVPTMQRRDISSRIGAVRQRAKKSGVPFSITTDQYMALWFEQKGLCALTGRKMTLGKRLGTSLNSASLDRIDAGLGYVIGNVRFVTVQANAARWVGNDQDLIEFCEDVLSYFCTATGRLRKGVELK